MARAIPLVAIALALSCSGQVLESDSAGVSAGDAGTMDAAADSSTTPTVGSDGCSPGGSASVFWQDSPGVRGIAVDDANAYWSTGYTIFSCPLSGCTSPIEIASLHGGAPNPSPIAIDSDNIYFIASVAVDSGGDTSVYRCPKSGCVGDPELVSPHGLYPTTLTLDETSVYWAASVPSRSVMRIGKDLTGLTTIAGAEAMDAVSHGTIFWIHPQTTLGDPNGSIMSCPIAGCAKGATTIADKQGYMYQLAVDDQNVYWTADADFGNTDGAILSCPQSGCSDAPTAIASGLYGPLALTVDGCGIYWSSTGSPPDSSDWRLGDVFMCEKPACTGAPTVLATGQRYASAFAVNARGIFWTTYEGGTVARMSR